MHPSTVSKRTGFGIATLLCAGFIAMPAAAQNMKPGLWEITNKMGGEQGAQMAEMQKQMASMPPEQRKMMQEMMAKQGVNMAPGGGGMAVRVCITKEMAARNEAPAGQQGDCKQEQVKRSGNTTRFKFTCTNPPGSGEGEYTLHSPESYSMKMNMTGQSAKGRPGNMTMDAQGKFISSDCGNVKPIKG